jgi:hypothetical protein
VPTTAALPAVPCAIPARSSIRQPRAISAAFSPISALNSPTMDVDKNEWETRPLCSESVGC